MAINLYNIKKWYKMLTGNSLMHVNQSIGENFSKDCIKGYYNNLTEKVTKDETILYTDELPLNEIEDGRKVFFQEIQQVLCIFDATVIRIGHALGRAFTGKDNHEGDKRETG